MSVKILLVVSAALWSWEKQAVLLAQRPEGKDMAGLWEFPGGKVESYETPEKALIRELDEELKIKVASDHLVPLNFVSYAYPRFHLLMPLYFCDKWIGKIDCQEHQAYSWARLDDLEHYAMPPADRSLPKVIKHYMSSYNHETFPCQEKIG